MDDKPEPQDLPVGKNGEETGEEEVAKNGEEEVAKPEDDFGKMFEESIEKPDEGEIFQCFGNCEETVRPSRIRPVYRRKSTRSIRVPLQLMTSAEARVPNM